MNRKRKLEDMIALFDAALGNALAGPGSSPYWRGFGEKPSSSAKEDHIAGEEDQVVANPSLEGEGVVPPVKSLEGEGVVPPVQSMEGPPEEEKARPAKVDREEEKDVLQTKEGEYVPPLLRLVYARMAQKKGRQNAWLAQAIVAKELLSTPYERRRARQDRMVRRLRRQRGE